MINLYLKGRGPTYLSKVKNITILCDIKKIYYTFCFFDKYLRKQKYKEVRGDYFLSIECSIVNWVEKSK